MGLEVNNFENEKACADKEAENMKNSMKKQVSKGNKKIRCTLSTQNY